MADGKRGYVEELIKFLKEGTAPIDEGVEDRIRLFAIKRRDETARMVGDGQLTFGKYAGKTIAEVAGFDAGYVKWLAKNGAYCHEVIKADIEREMKRIGGA